jgi:putative ABC transport system permease protein
MSFLSAVRVALGALLVNKGRSFLTSLGIVIGISAVIAMVAAGTGARNILDERLESVGKNLILIKPGARTETGIVTDFTPLKRADADAIRKHVNSKWLVGVAESQMTRRLATTRNGSHLTPLVGSVAALQKVRRWEVIHGRFLTEDDVRSSAPVCVIGQTVVDKLFPNKEDPLKDKASLRIDRVQLRVVGILEPKGRAPTGADQDDQIFMPITTMEQKLTGQDKVDLIVSAASSDDVIEKAKDAIIAVMRDQRHIKPGSTDNFDVSTVAEMSSWAVLLAKTMRILIAVIASVSLIVGGIGIMNIMLVSVTERTREIGIRMAIGATPSDVLRQFLIEAVVLALAGGAIGIALGLGGAVALAHYASWPVVYQPEVVALAFCVAAGVGIFFGYYPAWKASRLDPIEALRYE